MLKHICSNVDSTEGVYQVLGSLTNLAAKCWWPLDQQFDLCGKYQYVIEIEQIEGVVDG